MKSSKVNVWDKATALQYNNLREDAKQSSYLLVHQTTPASADIYVQEWYFAIGTTKINITGQTVTWISFPSSTDKKWLLLSAKSDWTITKSYSAASGSPTKPSLPSGEMPLAYIYLTSTWIINDDNNSTDWYIEDSRLSMVLVDDNNIVHKSWNETLDWIKTFIQVMKSIWIDLDNWLANWANIKLFSLWNDTYAINNNNGVIKFYNQTTSVDILTISTSLIKLLKDTEFRWVNRFYGTSWSEHLALWNDWTYNRLDPVSDNLLINWDTEIDINHNFFSTLQGKMLLKNNWPSNRAKSIIVNSTAADNTSIEWDVHYDRDWSLVWVDTYQIWAYPKDSGGSILQYSPMFKINYNRTTPSLSNIEFPNCSSVAFGTRTITTNWNDWFINTGSTWSWIVLRPNGAWSTLWQLEANTVWLYYNGIQIANLNWPLPSNTFTGVAWEALNAGWLVCLNVDDNKLYHADDFDDKKMDVVWITLSSAATDASVNVVWMWGIYNWFSWLDQKNWENIYLRTWSYLNLTNTTAINQSTGGSTQNLWHTFSTDWAVWQSFTTWATDKVLSEVSFFIKKIRFPSWIVTAYLTLDSNKNQILAKSVDIVTSYDTTSSELEFKFLFEDVAINPSTTYFVYLGASNMNKSEYYQLTCSTSNTYAWGMVYKGSSFTAVSGIDLKFKAQLKTSSTPVNYSLYKWNGITLPIWKLISNNIWKLEKSKVSKIQKAINSTAITPNSGSYWNVNNWSRKCVRVWEKIYFWGGEYYGWSFLSSFKVYDIKLNTVTDLANMPQSRIGHIYWYANWKIYVFGWLTTSSVPVTSIWKYDIASDTWSTISWLSLPTGQLTSATCWSWKWDVYYYAGDDTSWPNYSNMYLYKFNTTTETFSVYAYGWQWWVSKQSAIIWNDVYLFWWKAGSSSYFEDVFKFNMNNKTFQFIASGFQASWDDMGWALANWSLVLFTKWTTYSYISMLNLETLLVDTWSPHSVWNSPWQGFAFNNKIYFWGTPESPVNYNL